MSSLERPEDDETNRMEFLTFDNRKQTALKEMLPGGSERVPNKATIDDQAHSLTIKLRKLVASDK
jgi:hypothetical protein